MKLRDAHEVKASTPLQLVEKLEKEKESMKDTELLRRHLKQLRQAWGLEAKEEAEAAA